MDLVVTAEAAEAVEALTEAAVEEKVDNLTSIPDPEIGPAQTRHAEITTSHGGLPATSATQNDRKVQEMLEDLEVAEAEVVEDSEEIAEEAVTEDSAVTAVEVVIADLEAIVAADLVIAVETVEATAVMVVALEVVPCAVDEEEEVVVVGIVTDPIRTSDTSRSIYQI